MEKYSYESLSYTLFGEGVETVFLHGWGQNKIMTEPIAKLLKGYKVLCIDLPGFGSSKEPDEPLLLVDYVELLHEFFTKINFIPKVLIGHSFGGKIAFLYSLIYKVDFLVLASPSIIKPSFNFKRSYRIIKYKILKKFNSKSLFKYGSIDYKNASKVMKITLINSTNTYYNRKLKYLKTPTLIYWGINDTVTPLKQAYKIKKGLVNSKLVIHESGDHFAYFNYRYHFTNNIIAFIGEYYGV